MDKNTHITLGAHYEQFIAQQIAQGHFSSANEAVHAALALLEEREKKLATLRRALIEGEESGPSPYSLKDILHDLDMEESAP